MRHTETLGVWRPDQIVPRIPKLKAQRGCSTLPGKVIYIDIDKDHHVKLGQHLQEMPQGMSIMY